MRSLVSRSASSMCRTQNLVVLGSPKNQTVWSTGTLKHTVKQGAETKIGYHRPNPAGLRKCQEKLVLQTLVVRYLERIVKKRAERPLGLMKSKMAVVVGLHVLGLLPLDDPHSHQKNSREFRDPKRKQNPTTDITCSASANEECISSTQIC